MAAIVAAGYFQNHDEWALCILIKLGDIPPLSVSCFNCVAKKEKFFVWRLHLICTEVGILGSHDLLLGAYRDSSPIHELAFPLPAGASVFGDKGYISARDVCLLLFPPIS